MGTNVAKNKNKRATKHVFYHQKSWIKHNVFRDFGSFKKGRCLLFIWKVFKFCNSFSACIPFRRYRREKNLNQPLLCFTTLEIVWWQGLKGCAIYLSYANCRCLNKAHPPLFLLLVILDKLQEWKNPEQNCVSLRSGIDIFIISSL